MKALQIELLKLLRPSTYILAGILLLILIGRGVLGFHMIIPDMNNLVKNTDAGMADSIALIFTIFVIMNIGQEYSENTLRRSIIEGYTRGQFFLGKILLIIVSAVLLLVVEKLIFLSLAASYGYFKEGVDCLSVTGILYALTHTLMYGLFGFFLVFLTRNVAISIVIAFVWINAEGLLNLYLKFKYPEANWGAYMPITSLAKIIGVDGAMSFGFLFIALGYQILMGLGAYALLTKRDIK
jgi:ABC-type transport system involved in multi-copper enzyme maturation permease subunit